MFDNFFRKKKDNEEDKKIKVHDQKSHTQSESKKEEFYQRVTSSYSQMSPEFEIQGMKKVSPKTNVNSDLIKIQNDTEDLTEEKMLKVQSKVDEPSDLIFQSPKKTQRILDNDVEVFRRKKVDSPISSVYKPKFSNKEKFVSIILLENGIFGEDVLKVITLAQEITSKYCKCVSNNDYISNKILKYSFGEFAEDITSYVSKGKNLIEIFNYLSSLDLFNLKTSEDLNFFSDREKCIQLIVLGEGNFDSYSEEEISFLKQEITKMRDNEINTYFITTNKYNFADLANIGFRNIECINHEYNKI